MNGLQQTSDLPAGPGHDPPDGWAAALDRRLATALYQHGVPSAIVDRFTVRLEGVPLGADFSKPRSNLLLRRAGLECGSSVFVDCDLAYTGGDRGLATALAGPSHRRWRRLRLPPVRGSVNEALSAVLRMLGSPLAPLAVQALAPPAAPAREAARTAPATPPGRVLSAVGEVITPEMALAAWRTSVRRRLAGRLAAVTTRAAPPRAAVLWGQAGSGRDHLLLAAAHPLLESGRVRRAFRVSGAMLAAGCLVAQEIDAGLMHLLAEAEAEADCLLLVQDLDLCVTGTPVSLALLDRALDRGLKMLASVRGTGLLRRIPDDGPTARRLAVIHVPSTTAHQTAEVLAELPGGGVKVAPATVQAAVHLARQDGPGQPGGAMGLLSAAIAEAAWEGRPAVEPDDLFAVLESQWPGDEEEDDE